MRTTTTAYSRDPVGAGFIAVIGLTSALGFIVGGGSLVVTLAPILLVAIGYLIVRLPLRWSATSLAFLLLALDMRTDAGGLWASPLVELGELLYFGLGRILKINVAGFELLIVVLASIAIWRRAKTPDPNHIPAPTAARDIIVIYLGGVLVTASIGFMNGFGLPPWKIRYLLHGLLFFLLFQTAYRRPRDFHPLAVAVVLAAHVKALLAAWVQLVAAPALTGGKLAAATNHGDSFLFAMAMLILLVPAFEQPTRRNWIHAGVFSLLPMWGVVLNNRRLAWAMLALSLIAIFLLSPWRPWKRVVTKILLIFAPIVALYVFIGWTYTPGGIFTPVSKLQSMIDSSNPSTYWRDVETWNIAETIRESSALGIGLGGEYTEYIFNDDIADVYPDYRGWPHNTVLGLLLMGGVPGFTAIWLLYPFIVFLALRVYARATDPADRSAALLCISVVVCCAIMAWGDTGAHFKQYNLALGAALALAGKLAITTGGWRGRPPSAHLAL